MERKVTYTTQVFAQYFVADEQTFTVDIYCPFTPDEITFSNLTATIPVGDTDDNLYLLSSDLVSSIDNVIGVFQPNNNIMSTEITFQNKKTISGKFNFKFDAPITNDGTILTFTMKFLKYN